MAATDEKKKKPEEIKIIKKPEGFELYIRSKLITGFKEFCERNKDKNYDYTFVTDSIGTVLKNAFILKLKKNEEELPSDSIYKLTKFVNNPQEAEIDLESVKLICKALETPSFVLYKCYKIGHAFLTPADFEELDKFDEQEFNVKSENNAEQHTEIVTQTEENSKAIC